MRLLGFLFIAFFRITQKVAGFELCEVTCILSFILYK